MFLETVHTPGIAHLSYLVGDGSEAAVIDPRRDVEVYLDLATSRGAAIRAIFETHRNEDLVTGSAELQAATGAPILHGAAFDFGYGTPVRQGQRFAFGALELEVLETPGHTFESLSFVLRDRSTSAEEPLAVFTGDALFVGDVGRTDFYPDRAREVAGLLYDSIFEKLLPLGDHVVLFPAHGAGSVCGASMADRNFSTLGYERQHNPMLQCADRDAFIDAKIAEKHVMPPYFRKMEQVNGEGQPLLGRRALPPPIPARRFAETLAAGDLLALDLRSPEAIAGAFIPGSLGLPHSLIAGYAGWLLPYDRPLALILDGPRFLEESVHQFSRLGYDRIVGYLDGGLSAWETSGRSFGHIATRDVEHIEALASDRRESVLLLDVRKESEVEETGRIPGAEHVFLGELPQRLADLPRERTIVTYCTSGKRATVAASLLKKAGFDDVEVFLGSTSAWTAANGKLEKGAA